MDVTRLWPSVETATALSAGPLAAALFLSALVFAAQRDLRTRTIPDRLVAALFLLWLLAAPLAGLAPRDMALGVGAAAMVFFGTVALYAMGWMGGGDSKLLTVSALWLGAEQVVPFLMATMLAGAGLALGMLALKILPRPAQGAARLRGLAQAELPYALAIGLGAVCILPRTLWMGAL